MEAFLTDEKSDAEMGDWIIVDYNYYLSSEGFTVIKLDVFNEKNQPKPLCKGPYKILCSVKEYMANLNGCKGILETVKWDVLRSNCYVNGRKIQNIQELKTELNHTNLKDIIVVCNQGSLAPLVINLYRELCNEEEEIHLIDGLKNRMKFSLWIYNKNKIRVEITKNLMLVKLEDGEIGQILNRVYLEIYFDYTPFSKEKVYYNLMIK